MQERELLSFFAVAVRRVGIRCLPINEDWDCGIVFSSDNSSPIWLCCDSCMDLRICRESDTCTCKKALLGQLTDLLQQEYLFADERELFRKDFDDLILQARRNVDLSRVKWWKHLSIMLRVWKHHLIASTFYRNN